MSDQTFEAQHPRADAGRFTEKPQADPGGTVLTAACAAHQHEMWQIREGPTHFFCAACGDNVRVVGSACDRDGQPLPPCPVQVEVSYRDGRPERHAFDAATLLAGMGLDERRRLLGSPAELYRTATTQMLARWAMGDVQVTNVDELRQWVESHRDACLQGDGWRETHSSRWLAVEATDAESWPEAAKRANEHVEQITAGGRLAIVVHDGDCWEVGSAASIDEATALAHRFGFYETGTVHGSYASLVDGNLDTDRSATVYFPQS